MLEKQTSFVVGRLVDDILHRAKSELVVQVLNEVSKRGRSIFTDQEDIADLAHICECAAMVIDQRVASNCKNKNQVKTFRTNDVPGKSGFGAETDKRKKRFWFVAWP